MSSDELSLTWDDHHNALVKVFGKLLRASCLVDCTIAAEGQYIKAHKIILSACSPYFELLFKQENEKNPIVVLKDVKFQDLKAIIDFVYCGKVRVPQDRLGDFVDAAESLQIKGLGSDNYKSPCSGWISEGRENPHPPKHEFSGSHSPVRRKRRRPLSICEDNVSELSLGINVNDEYQSIENVPQEDKLDHQIGRLCSTENVLSRLCSSSVTVHSIQRIVETDSRASFAEPSPPPLEMLPNPDAMVIKTEPEPEPEPVTEVCLPEMDFEPKREEDVEDTIVLDSEDEVLGAVLNVDTQSSSNQYSGFPSALQTPDASSDNAFLMTDVAEHTSTQGGAEAYARRSRRLSSPVIVHQADLVLGEVMESTYHRSPSSSQTEAELSPRRRDCHLCGKIFRWPAGLVRHLRKHTGDRPFECDQCRKSFTQMCSLQKHRRIHTGERPFKCDQCGKDFSRSDHLQSHQLVHTGERPFKCEQCGKGFTQMHNLRSHMCVHTGE